jgi:hypothetical protein
VPAGRYAVLREEGAQEGTEEFRCAPGPMGWRYFSDIETTEPVPHHEIVDVVVDESWRPVRLRVDTGAHRLWLEAAGDRLTGERDGERIESPWHPAMHLDYLSPAFNAVTCRRLDATTEIEVIFVQPFTLEPVVERQRYDLLGEEEVDTPAGAFAATRWHFTSLGSGWNADLWVAADVVVAYERLFRLEWYEAGASGPQPLAR